MQASTEPNIIAIIRRNDDGLLERCEQANVGSDECVTLMKASAGIVVVIGPICETEASEIETIVNEASPPNPSLS